MARHLATLLVLAVLPALVSSVITIVPASPAVDFSEAPAVCTALGLTFAEIVTFEQFDQVRTDIGFSSGLRAWINGERPQVDRSDIAFLCDDCHSTGAFCTECIEGTSLYQWGVSGLSITETPLFNSFPDIRSFVKSVMNGNSNTRGEPTITDNSNNNEFCLAWGFIGAGIVDVGCTRNLNNVLCDNDTINVIPSTEPPTTEPPTTEPPTTEPPTTEPPTTEPPTTEPPTTEPPTTEPPTTEPPTTQPPTTEVPTTTPPSTEAPVVLCNTDDDDDDAPASDDDDAPASDEDEEDDGSDDDVSSSRIVSNSQGAMMLVMNKKNYKLEAWMVVLAGVAFVALAAIFGVLTALALKKFSNRDDTGNIRSISDLDARYSAA